MAPGRGGKALAEVPRDIQEALVPRAAAPGQLEGAEQPAEDSDGGLEEVHLRGGCPSDSDGEIPYQLR